MAEPARQECIPRLEGLWKKKKAHQKRKRLRSQCQQNQRAKTDGSARKASDRSTQEPHRRYPIANPMIASPFTIDLRQACNAESITDSNP
jgi:hypothetical protein